MSSAPLKTWLQIGGGVLLALVLVAAFLFRDEILRTSLDPRQPYQTYRPPAAPDYARASAWALLPRDPLLASARDGPADVFFIHPTTYDGGQHWNGPIDHRRSSRQLEQVMLPNYAGPFLRSGRLFAPRYRQASLYAMLALREDARAARAFAYSDVRRAFLTFLERYNQRRPFLVVGGYDGADEVGARHALKALGVAGDLFAHQPLRQRSALLHPDDQERTALVPACRIRFQARCVVAYMPAPRNGEQLGRRLLSRALVWGKGDELDPLAGRPSLCVNPLSGRDDGTLAPERENLGAANATALEWGLRPAFLPHQVSAQCEGGLLRISRPSSPELKPAGGWADRLKAPGYQLFYADLEADALARLKALQGTPGFHLPATPIAMSVKVRRVPVMGR